ncbi:hypothetical protein BDZ97DRAFT_1919960 [Flammula alnicola]|nr:hypothetical protein BDZ97DRAFT_1919960 [Flammula alnicola]
MVSSTTAQHHSSRGYDPIRCTLSEGKPCNPCLELTELDSQLAQVLADFERKRRLLKSEVNNRHDPLAHVPVEIALEIFTWYHEETYKPSIFGDSPESKQGSPLRLAAVCKTWREIAFKTPQLWTSLHIIHDPEHATPLHLELVAQWLDRSSKMPSYIRLQYTSIAKRRKEDVYPGSLFALIGEYAPQWNALNLVMPCHFYADFISNVEGAPLLEYLRLSPMDEDIEFFSFYLGKTPCLKSLDISQVYLSSIRIKWENLTRIQIKTLGVDEILEVLSRGTRLVDCKVLEIVEDLSLFDLPTSFLVRNSLRDLHVQPDDITRDADLRVLYDRLVLPSLRHFSYDSERYTGPVEVDSLLSLFTRSRSPITHFSLAIPQSSLLRDYNTIIQILEILPSITHLSLKWMKENTRSASITNSFLRHMASFSSMQHDTDTSRTNAFLPSLESFQYEEWWPSEKLSWGCLADIFHNPVEDNQTVKASNNIQKSQSSLPAIHYCNRRPSLRDFRMTFHSEGKNSPEPGIELDEDLRRLIGIRSAGVNLQILKVLKNGDVVDMIESMLSSRC